MPGLGAFADSTHNCSQVGYLIGHFGKLGDIVLGKARKTQKKAEWGKNFPIYYWWGIMHGRFS